MKNKFGFTLAEVLITLGIIGVVAAMTIPTLIKNYQKQVFYTQFRKATTVLENALKLYAVDNGCEGEISNCFVNQDYVWDNNFVDNFSKYFKISQLITEDNYEDVCKNYAIKSGFDTNDIYFENGCINDLLFHNAYAFITTDGMLFNFATDLGVGNGSFFDINGFKGPNAIGRDIFVFYLSSRDNNKSGIYLGGNESNNIGDSNSLCTKDDGSGCAAKLLQDGKMDY